MQDEMFISGRIGLHTVQQMCSPRRLAVQLKPGVSAFASGRVVSSSNKSEVCAVEAVWQVESGIVHYALVDCDKRPSTAFCIK